MNGEQFTLNTSDSRATPPYDDLLCGKFVRLFLGFPYEGDCSPSGSSHELPIALYLQTGMARKNSVSNDIRDEDFQSPWQNFVSGLDAHLGTVPDSITR